MNGRSILSWLGIGVLALGVLAIPRGKAAEAQGTIPFLYFPTASTTDGRFLTLTGTGTETLTGDFVEIQLGVPASMTQFEMGIFDGETSGMWDEGATPLRYTLCRDADADGVGDSVVNTWLGNVMADNNWWSVTIPTDAAAQVAPGRPYYYTLKVENSNPHVFTVSSFKVRATTTLLLKPQFFSSYVPLIGYPEFNVLYPTGDLGTSTYDGSWTFYMDAQDTQASVEIWDGDCDYGAQNGSTLDTDDPDTSNTVLPPWAVAVYDVIDYEGVAMGYAPGIGHPADDNASPYYVRAPSIEYRLMDPNGAIYYNGNPSGNTEWERFRIDSTTTDRNQADVSVPQRLPNGVYRLIITGMDVGNVNSWRMPIDMLGVDANGNPVPGLRPFAIGDYVWLDTDGDGQQDPGEAGIPGVVLELMDAGGFPVASATTTSGGTYLFDVRSTTWTVRVAASNFAPGGALYGLGSTTGDSKTRTLNNNNDFTYDFGYKPGTLSGAVIYDRDAGGTQNSGDTPISGAQVQLLDANGSVVGTTTTNASGAYSFSPLVGGTYTARVVTGTLPAGVTTPTADYDGISTAHTANAAVPAGGDRPNVDFLYTATASLGGKVVYDVNGNALMESGEPNLGGITVRLIDGSGAVVGTAVTAGDGSYQFNNLGEGAYSVVVDTATLPSGLTTQTYDLDGLSSPGSATVSLSLGQHLTNIDFAFTGIGALGDRVWLDVNGNGMDDLEPGIGGVLLQIYDGNGTLLGSTITDAAGSYWFGGLYGGSFTVKVVAASLPAGLQPSYDLDGTGSANQAVAGLALSQTRTDVDFGYMGAGSLGDRVWSDTDGDGVQDAGEAGISGVAISLKIDLNGDGIPEAKLTTVTADDGAYLFENLPAGRYTVSVDAATLPAGAGATYDLDGISTLNTATVALASGENQLAVDFGYRQPAAAGPYRTQTQGGWGTKPSGNNPGAFLAANFAAAFPNGLVVGGNKTITLRSAKAVEVFLPTGGTASPLTKCYIDPTKTEAGVLAGQIVAMTISVRFSAVGLTTSGLGSLKLQSGKFVGWTVNDFAALANQVLGGNLSALPAGTSVSDINDSATKINENFCDGNQDHGFLR